MNLWPVYRYTLDDLKEFKNNFIAELKAIEFGKSSLPGYINALPEESFTQEGETFQAIALGGTNFSFAVVHYDLPLQVIYQKQGKVPNLIDLESITRFLGEIIDPKVTKIVLNFAYPLKAQIRDGRLDGELVKGTRRHPLESLVGKLVGLTLENSLKEFLKRDIQIEVANDVVCLLQQPMQLNELGLAAGVVGTGFNFGFYQDANNLVNLESANFDKFRQSPTGLIVDQNSNYLGLALWEKEVAGAYLYMHYNFIADEQNWDRISSTDELSILTKSPTPQGACAKSLLERSANLVACQMAAIYEFMEIPMVTFVIEGNLFWSGQDYLLAIRKTLSDLGCDPVTNISILKAQAPLTGTIALGIRYEEEILS